MIPPTEHEAAYYRQTATTDRKWTFMELNPSAWLGRRVLLTGHTGFKGAWLALWLERMGARVTGLSLPPESADGAFLRLRPWNIDSHVGDIRDAAVVSEVMAEASPSIVLHLAAEAIVRRAYREPVATFQTNVMGTVNVLEAARSCGEVEAVLVVTSDKVYENATEAPAREADPLGHVDPYSSSKACVELLVRAWRASYFEAQGKALATARAGNVIGGGDTAPDRLVPDVLRADTTGQPVVLRSPESVRPWQHVLDPLLGYLLFAQRLLGGEHGEPHALNFGPDDLSWTVLHLIERLHQALGGGQIEISDDRGPREAPALLLNSELAKETLGWRPVLGTEDALEWTAQWHRTLKRGGELRGLALEQIDSFEARASA
jgi:CDP-glucose 4,6-dehydratase